MNEQQAEHRESQSQLYHPQHDTQEASTRDRELPLRGGSDQNYTSIFNPDEGANASRNDLDVDASEVNSYNGPLHQCTEANVSERPLSTFDGEQGMPEDLPGREFVVEQKHRGEDHDAEQTAQLDSHSSSTNELTQDTSTQHYTPSFNIPEHETFINPIEPPTLTHDQRRIDEIDEIELEERGTIEPMPMEQANERKPTIQSTTGHIDTHTGQKIVQLPFQTYQQPIQVQQQQQSDVLQGSSKSDDGKRGLCAPLKWFGQQVVGVWIYLQHNWFEPMYALLYLLD